MEALVKHNLGNFCGWTRAAGYSLTDLSPVHPAAGLAPNLPFFHLHCAVIKLVPPHCRSCCHTCQSSRPCSYSPRSRDRTERKAKRDGARLVAPPQVAAVIEAALLWQSLRVGGLTITSSFSRNSPFLHKLGMEGEVGCQSSTEEAILLSRLGKGGSRAKLHDASQVLQSK